MITLRHAPFAKLESIRLLLALSARNYLDVLQFDVQTAFLNATIDETVHMDPPEGLLIPDSKCPRIRKALYGLKKPSGHRIPYPMKL